MRLSNEAKVGAMIITTLILGFSFAWIIGIPNPFQQSLKFYVTYNFAGGLEVGSPVRVAGIKVGKVESIEFFTPVDPKQSSLKDPILHTNEEGKVLTPLKVKISVRKEATPGIRKDSHFYVNLAGIIGERYVEITPGNIKSAQLIEGDIIAGIDPPRIDQLISQSFNLAGKIQEIVEENKGDISKSIELLYKLSSHLNRTLSWIDKSSIFKHDFSELITNLIVISSDVRKITEKANSPETEKTLQLLHKLLWRLEPLNSKVIRDFFQKEGVKVQFF